MGQQTIGVGTSANDGTGDTIRAAFQKVNANFTELYPLAVSSNGLIARTSAGAYSARTITGTANKITVTNGDGVSGNPTLTFPTAMDLTGHTIANLFRLGVGGTIDPAVPLHVKRDSSTWELGIIDNQTASAGAILKFDHANAPTNGYDIGLLGSTDAFSVRRDAVAIAHFNSTGFIPHANGSYQLGGSSNRWSEVFASNGTINTSDEREKQNIGAIPDDWLDAWGDVAWVRYRKREAVKEKGAAARWHVGLVAQRVHAAFEQHGIDAFEIGLVCFDEWEDQHEEATEGLVLSDIVNKAGERMLRKARVGEKPVAHRSTGKTRVVQKAGDSWGLRYTECEAMEAAWQRREIARQADRIAALEAKLAARP